MASALIHAKIVGMLAVEKDPVYEAAAKVPVLRELPESELAALLTNASIDTAPRGRVLANAGRATAEILFLTEGAAKICQVTSEGREATIALLGPGAHIGVSSLLNKTARATEVVASSRVRFLQIKARDFERHLLRHPALSHALLLSLSRRLDETSRHLAEQSLYPLPRRLAIRLLELAQPVELFGEEVLLVRQRPAHQELANMMGVTREAVTRALKQLEKDGHIRMLEDQVVVISTPY